jgi:hypothetical protein
MKTLLKLAVGAAIAGAVVSFLAKRQTRNEANGAKLLPMTRGSGRVPAGSSGFTLEEIAGENAEWGGGGSGLNA